jgi:hypothetical protein
MTKYVVAYSDEVDTRIDQQIVDAASARDAVIQYLASFQDIVLSEEDMLQTEDVDLLADYLWDYHSGIISVIKI